MEGFFLFKSLTSMFKFHLQDMYNAFKSRIPDIIGKKEHRTVFSNVRLDGRVESDI